MDSPTCRIDIWECVSQKMGTPSIGILRIILLNAGMIRYDIAALQ